MPWAGAQCIFLSKMCQETLTRNPHHASKLKGDHIKEYKVRQHGPLCSPAPSFCFQSHGFSPTPSPFKTSQWCPEARARPRRSSGQSPGPTHGHAPRAGFLKRLHLEPCKCRDECFLGTNTFAVIYKVLALAFPRFRDRTLLESLPSTWSRGHCSAVRPRVEYSLDAHGTPASSQLHLLKPRNIRRLKALRPRRPLQQTSLHLDRNRIGG